MNARSVGGHHWLTGWLGASVNNRILAAAFTVAGFTLLVKATATARELAVAYRFGTGDAVDAFLIAFLIPSLLLNVFAGSLPAAFTPVYIQLREGGGATAARRLLGSTILAGSVFVVAFMILLALLAPLALRLLGAGFSAEKLALTRALFLLLLPILLLNFIATLWSAVLNADGLFAAVAVAPIAVPLASLIAVVYAGRSFGIYSLAVGTVIGFVLQCVVLAFVLSRKQGRAIPIWAGITPDLLRVGSQYLPMIAGAILTSSSWAIGQAMAATLPSGSVAALNYGNKVVAMVSEVGSMALATAVLPHFSLMVAKREWSTIRRTVQFYLRLIILTAVPATLLLVVLSPLIVRFLFERGAFTAADSRIVAAIQSFYFLQIPFVMVGMVFVRLASSLQKNQILLGGAALTLPINVVLNLALMNVLGVAGIALSTSLVFAVSCVYLVVFTRRALSSCEKQYPNPSIEIA